MTYKNSGITGSNDDDISTRNYTWTDFLQLGLDFGDDIVSPHRIIIWTCTLFSLESGSVFKKYRRITTLLKMSCNMSHPKKKSWRAASSGDFSLCFADLVLWSRHLVIH